MTWNHDRSLKRATNYFSEIGDITVTPVVKEMDFEAITLNHPRKVIGAHAYTDVVNFRSITGDGAASVEQIRALHIYGREAARIVEQDFGAVKVHLQGPKAHVISYRPISDDAKKVVAATLSSVALVRALRILSSELGLDPVWKGACGVDFGEVLVTKDGVRGDRELLFLGSAANRAAKIVDTGVLLTQAAADLLPSRIAEHLVQRDDLWRLTLTDDALDDLAAHYGHAWSRAGCRERIRMDAAAITLDTVKVCGVEGAIDKGVLSVHNNKAVAGVSIFADVDGFTAYIESAEDRDELAAAVRAFHVQRSELRNVLKVDFPGLRIQYQGDRIQGFVYLPIDTYAKVAVDAVRCAAALHSTTTEVLPQVIGDAAKPLAIGMAFGETVVTKLGERGHRDVVALGEAVAEAARIQQALDGGCIGIDAALRDLLPEWIHEYFNWDPHACAYVARDLSYEELDRRESAETLSLGKSLVGAALLGAATLGAAALLRHRGEEPPPTSERPPLRPWMP